MLYHRRNNLVRAALGVVGFISALTGPIWLPLLAMALLSLRWAAWEVLVLGAFVDMIWLPASPMSIPFYTIAAIVLLWGLGPLRRLFLVG